MRKEPNFFQDAQRALLAERLDEALLLYKQGLACDPIISEFSGLILNQHS